MSKEKIGLKLANGDFYPVLDAGMPARKRLVVTTVQDRQRSVQIDLYQGPGPSLQDTAYLGSLVVEGIPPMAKGEPDIRMEIQLGDEQTLSAFAEEASTGTSQSLEVSLKTLAEEEKYEIPDFEFSGHGEEALAPLSFDDADFEGTDVLPLEAETSTLTESIDYSARTIVETVSQDRPGFAITKEESLYGQHGSPVEHAAQAGLLVGEDEKENNRRSIWFIPAIIMAILLIAALGFLVYRFVLGGGMATASNKKPAQTSAVVSSQPAPAAVPPATTPPVSTQPAATKPATAPLVTPPVTTQNTASTQAAKEPGNWYTIRWGDTLWDLSYAFYRTPWYFGKIAKANKIKNPDRIISGHRIWIPKL